MTFRTRLFLILAVTVVTAVALVGWTVLATTRRAFERLLDQQVAALVAQFNREFQRRGEEIARRAAGIAGAESTLNLALAASRPDPDYSPYFNEAQSIAAAQGLDFLVLAAGDGSIISSAQWPARFGYREEWLLGRGDWNRRPAFLRGEELPNGETALALLAVRTLQVGERTFYVVGGQQLDREFMNSLVLPDGMRAVLYSDLDHSFRPAIDGGRLGGLITEARGGHRASRAVTWPDGAPETFHAIPLLDSAERFLGAFLVGNSRREQAELERFLLWTGLGLGGGAVLLAVALSGWATARVTRPVRLLAQGAREVAAGNWNARVEVSGGDEIGALAGAFNQMTRQLMEQRDRLVQAERVAAWRELARRLAHELKNPLFPLQLTVENMQHAREAHREQFDEVFREGSATMLAELANLKRIVARFSDFARMPPPELQPVDLNELARGALKLFEAQLRAAGVEARLEPDPRLRPVPADPEQWSGALRNLLLNAIDAMPAGGQLTVRTVQQGETARLEVSDTGQGLTPEECERLFTPYYTTKQHGTGLGLAIVQSVVSDHQGRITVESEPGQGSTFRIELRAEPPPQG